MKEAVRLVIWDLDGVFWQGTLTEGGIEYSDRCHEMVMELARRGIISSICSKNDPDRIRTILSDRGIWDFFVFPSVNWEPKGPRIAQIVRLSQLRAETVLFIDDNPLNIAEAEHCVPGIQTANEDFLPILLSDLRFEGKDDQDLTRLRQYKILEARAVDLLTLGSDNREFLRASQIKVVVNYSVEENLDRAIELINRTNQLNYTKRRLPEDQETARIELRTWIERYDVFCGLVEVSDRYGDYGYIGFFLAVGARGRASLVHFCFSCRTINMGIENWIYDWLGRPKLTVIGEIVTEITHEKSDIDWITFQTKEHSSSELKGDKILHRLVLRGGCDLSAIAHYLVGLASEMQLEINTSRDGRQFRLDHSAVADLTLSAIDKSGTEALEELGYIRSDWESGLSIIDPPGTNLVWILSFWTDLFTVLYEHLKFGFRVPFLLPHDPHAICDVTSLPDEYLRSYIINDDHRTAYQALCKNFKHTGVIDKTHFQLTMKKIKGRIPGGALLFIMLGPESFINLKTGAEEQRSREIQINSWLREVFRGTQNVELVEVNDFVEKNVPRAEALHFDRIVYRKAADFIRTKIISRFR